MALTPQFGVVGACFMTSLVFVVFALYKIISSLDIFGLLVCFVKF